MAVEKMKLLGITGKGDTLNEFIANVLFKSDVQIEDAKKNYNKGWKLNYYEYDYTIKDSLKKCEKLLDKLEVVYSKTSQITKLEDEAPFINEQIQKIDEKYEKNLNLIKENNIQNKQDYERIEEISKIADLKIDMKKLYDLKYIKFRYGSIPNKNLDDIKNEIDNLYTVFYEVKKEKNITWIIYFTTSQYVSTIDGIFNIQKFERQMFPADLVETPSNYIAKIKDRINRRNFYTSEAEESIERIKKKEVNILLKYYRELQTYDKINSIKKYIVKDQNNTFYIVAWTPESNLEKIKKDLDEFPNLDYVVKDGEHPPTKLKNSKFIKPFEALVKMYGMPRQDELDPTWFVALTTFIMFGFMFGDVGHGLVFLILGIILLIKKKSYGAIALAGGISSMIFGVLYGSVFGKEDIIKSIVISPINDISTMLVYGIAVGTIFIVMAMILNIVNGVKNKNINKIFLSQNGLAGILLYGFVLTCVAYYFLTGKMLISINIIVIISVLLSLIIMFNEQILNFIEHKKEKAKTPFVEKVFEIIEMILSFLSNTISFLRLAAFAINHAGLCMAVYLLADMSVGAGNILIAILGNVIVIVLEGLIVGIQTLRLEYYELFSRFYDGSGQEYQSIQEALKI